MFRIGVPGTACQVMDSPLDLVAVVEVEAAFFGIPVHFNLGPTRLLILQVGRLLTRREVWVRSTSQLPTVWLEPT